MQMQIHSYLVENLTASRHILTAVKIISQLRQSGPDEEIAGMSKRVAKETK